MMNDKPLVTVLIPVYNRPHVVATIHSICSQTYDNLEILVVDNASTDGTVQAIQEIEDPRIKLLKNEENKGQTYSLNRGLCEASGKYIARIDSDDIAYPTRIEKQVSFLESHDDYVLVGSWVRFISDDDKPGMIVKMCTTDEGMRLMQTVACGMYHPSAMFRRDTIKTHNMNYDPSFHMAEDYDLWVRLMQCGKACNIGEPLIYYRRGNNNDSRTHRTTMNEESAIIRRRVCDALECGDEERTRIRNEIELEDKSEKTLAECLRIHKFYKAYLSNHISSDSVDYQILKLHFNIKVYSACFATNPRPFAAGVRKAYALARGARNKIGQKRGVADPKPIAYKFE